MSILLPQLLLSRTSKLLSLAIRFSLSSAAFAAGAAHLPADVKASEADDKVSAPFKKGSAIPEEFLGIWGSSFEACDDKNIGLILLVRRDFLSLTDRSKPSWVLPIKSVSADVNDNWSIIIQFDPPTALTKSPDYEPVVRFVEFGKMTLTEEGQGLTVSDLAGAKRSSFVFCDLLPDPEKKAG